MTGYEQFNGTLHHVETVEILGHELNLIDITYDHRRSVYLHKKVEIPKLMTS